MRETDVGHGDAVDPHNRASLRRDMQRMKQNPVTIERPIVILSGWRSPGLQTTLGARLRRLTGARAEQMQCFAFPLAGDIQPCAARVARMVASRFGAHDGHTSTVDVVAVSMGGLVARLAASSLVQSPVRLDMHRLFTLGTPHLGAKLARRVRIDRASRAMRPGSIFLQQLDDELELATYELIAYAALDDWMVGATNSAPYGQNPIWFDGAPLFSHHLISFNTPIVVDIARRLRNEQPIARPSRPPRD